MLDSDGRASSQSRSSLSTPTTATSSGTRRPVSRQASTTCSAHTSWQAKTPTGFGQRPQPALQAARSGPAGGPAGGRTAPGARSNRPGSGPPAASACAEPGFPLGRVEMARWPTKPKWRKPRSRSGPPPARRPAGDPRRRGERAARQHGGDVDQRPPRGPQDVPPSARLTTRAIRPAGRTARKLGAGQPVACPGARGSSGAGSGQTA